MSRMIDRRSFLTAPLALFTPMPVLAQVDNTIRRIAFVGFFTAGPGLVVFRTALRDLGYVEGRDVVVETRFAGGEADRLPEIMAELVSFKVDVIVAASTLTVLAAMRATKTIPIVFASVFDPVGSGLVSSLALPGGNVTGAAIGVGGSGLGGKWLELLKEFLPTLTDVGALVNTNNPASAASLSEIETAAQVFQLRVHVYDVNSEAILHQALAELGASPAQGLIVTNDPVFTPHADKLVAFAATRRLPAIYYFSMFAEAGGLMAYGASADETYQRAAAYVDRVLRGAKAATLPVEQPTHLRLIVNLRTAKSLGLAVPESILARADGVIE